jgi:hypothetical protein
MARSLAMVIIAVPTRCHRVKCLLSLGFTILECPNSYGDRYIITLNLLIAKYPKITPSPSSGEGWGGVKSVAFSSCLRI